MAQIRRFIYAVITLLVIQHTLYAQTPGTFTHTIKQGETVYSIARIYKVSPDAILNINPSASQGIKAGETLVIPQQQNGTPKERFHTIQPEETLYKLTQVYKVSAESICQANPGLTAENFKIGMVIRIPEATETTTQPVATPQQTTTPQGLANSGCREMHKVKRKETLYSIAKEFQITEEELRAANPEMNQPDYKLRKGDFICIPYPKPKVETPKEVAAPSNEELLVQRVAAPQKHIRMGVILPFKGGTPENDKMIEFYRGVLMAVDKMKASGISIDVFAYDSGKNAADIKKVVNSHPITNLDFIIGPLYAGQITELSAFCQKHQIKLAVPFSSLGDNVYQNPYYYAVNPPKSYTLSEAGKLTMELFGKENIIFLNSTDKDEEAVSFVETIQKQLQTNGSKFNTLNLNSDEYSWQKAMTQYKNNVIIPNSANIKFLNQLFPKLKEFTQKYPEYKIKLVGYPEWQTYTNSHLENFYQFDTYAYSSFFRNPLDGNSDRFEKQYQQAFHTPTIVSWPRFGMLGFDIASYFLKGISTYGKGFEQNLSGIITSPYQHKFDFQRISNWSGFINREIEFIHYSPSHNIELIRLKK